MEMGLSHVPGVLDAPVALSTPGTYTHLREAGRGDILSETEGPPGAPGNALRIDPGYQSSYRR